MILKRPQESAKSTQEESWVILAPQYILGQVRSCNLLGRRAGQGSNKRLIQAEICLDIPPGAAFGGAPRALRALGRGDI